MYTVMNRIPVPAAGAAAFEERFAAGMRETLHAVPGLVGARLLRPEHEGGTYVAVMDFTSADAFAAWRRSDSFRAAHGPSTGRTDAQVETFETVASVGV